MSALIHVAEMEAVSRRCASIVARCLRGANVRAIEAKTRFLEDLRADSLDMVTLAMAVEEEFGIAVSDDAAAEIESFGDMCALAARLFAERGAYA